MKPTGLSPAELRRTFAHFPSGVVAICAAENGRPPTGMAVSTFIPVSLEPPLIAVSLQGSSRTWPVLRQRPVLGVSVLAEHQSATAQQLAAYEGDRFAGLSTSITDSGAVFVDGAVVHYECTVDQLVTAGDHILAVLEIRAAHEADDATPLIFHRSRYGGVSPLAVDATSGR